MSDVTIGLLLMLATGMVVGFIAGVAWTLVLNKAVKHWRHSHELLEIAAKDICDGRFCRQVEHQQNMCNCEEIAEYFQVAAAALRRNPPRSNDWAEKNSVRQP